MYFSKLAALAAIALTASASQQPQFPLTRPRPHHGVTDIPPLGFGTWNLSPDKHNASKAVSHALQTGYRHIDCAAAYKNEVDVGRGIKDGLRKAHLRRDQVWITSKLWNDHHEPKQVEKALDKTLHDLGLDYLDLYLMHWPVGQDHSGNSSIYFLPTWHALSKLRSTGKVRHVGISNFSPAQLAEVLADSSPESYPYSHQMELHPYLPQTAWLQYHYSHGIRVTAYSPLGNSNPTYDKPTNASREALLKNDIVTEIANDRSCSPAQVVLAWGISRGVAVIPKSKHASRIEENFAVVECRLEYEDFAKLNALGVKGKRFNNPSGQWGVELFDGLEDS